jgi:foldase protein PrsA
MGAWRRIVVAAALASGGVAAAGCGSSGGSGANVPTGAVATVGGAPIARAAFVAELRSQAVRNARGGTPVPYDFPDFKACVAAKRTRADVDVDLSHDECEQEFKRLRLSTMQALLQSEWIRRDAAARRLSVSTKQLDATVRARQVQFGGGDSKRYRAYLRKQGLTEQTFRDGIRQGQLIERIQQSVKTKVPKPGSQEVSQFYDANKAAFALPERRDARIVLARTKAQAEQAKLALARGESWEATAKRFSIDPATKDKGGKLRNYSRSRAAGELDDSLFTASRGKLGGPLETQFGWYVYTVERVLPAHKRPLTDVRKQIVDYLHQQEQRRALDDFSKKWVSRYRQMTTCADDFKVAECGNGPATNPVDPNAAQSSQQTPQ